MKLHILVLTEKIVMGYLPICDVMKHTKFHLYMKNLYINYMNAMHE